MSSFCLQQYIPVLTLPCPSQFVGTNTCLVTQWCRWKLSASLGDGKVRSDYQLDQFIELIHHVDANVCFGKPEGVMRAEMDWLMVVTA